MNAKKSILLIAAILTLFPAVYTSANELGDPAAPISIAEWIKGESIELKLDKNIYVVEFWATWCGPCLDSIPHLTELQKKYKDKGVMIIGISNEDASTVRPYVEKMGDKMAYTVAIDVERKTNSAYMKAYGQNGIPTAFIVDKELKIAWVGHPMGGLDTALQEITTGTYDIQAARKADFAKQNLPAYFNLAKSGSEKEARELGEKILAGGMQDAMLMNQLAWEILTMPDLKKRDLDLAMRSAQAAYDACQGKDPSILDTYARALRDTGDLDKAIEYQKKAVALATNSQLRESIAATLKEYEEELSR